MKDLFYEQDYGRLYEKIENGTCELFEFNHRLGKVHHLFIKRPIPEPISGATYYDLVTPYGYGGPVITEVEPGDEKKLAQKFEEAFQKYCFEHRIVSEFVRFHPVFSNALDFEECYEIIHRRKTTGTNLSAFEDPVQKEFSKSTRRNIRKALEAGVTFRITVNPESLKNFKEIYYHTMERNKAEAIYYFDDDYFDNCLSLLGENIVFTEVLYEDQIIGMGLSFFYGDRIHTHLSGTLDDFHHLSPAYVLQYALTVWGKENGMSLIHDGGGRTASPDDKLFKFKKQFGKNTEFDYYIGHKIWNKEIYHQLCELTNTTLNDAFFPAYRAKVEVEA
ncbi:GNAT family N-acetyltransferase [Planococcus salinus]|uniref:Lipid II:glycine glycyltransferase n=1 Tax=Planococcus salinus TaxID=1848460 RepID=A0A3M8P771_9BACL|nr:GNAT family N-acetyltransferase [Planococcus salinus]RNF39528.1 GNAT family N-acetyltransferase [Planococcus salinus]